MSATTSTTCIGQSGGCTSCNPAIIDPNFGTGCLSTRSSQTVTATGTSCSCGS